MASNMSGARMRPEFRPIQQQIYRLQCCKNEIERFREFIDSARTDMTELYTCETLKEQFTGLVDACKEIPALKDDIRMQISRLRPRLRWEFMDMNKDLEGEIVWVFLTNTLPAEVLLVSVLKGLMFVL